MFKCGSKSFWAEENGPPVQIQFEDNQKIEDAVCLLIFIGELTHYAK